MRRAASIAGTGARQTRQHGVALLTVLMITALATAMVVALLSRHQLAIARTGNVVGGAQALEYALGAESFGRHLLFRDFVEDETPPKTDTLADIWALPGAPFEISGGQIIVQISDLQARFNVNSLAQRGRTSQLQRARRLLAALGLPVALADRLQDWVDADQQITGFGAEDGEYLLADPPYRAANRALSDVSELRLVMLEEELEEDDWRLLQSAITTLPPSVTQINANTAGPAALLSLSERLAPGEAEAFAESERLYEDPAQVVNDLSALGPAVDALAVASSYFEVGVRVEYLDTVIHLASVIYRDPNTGMTHVLSRNVGRPTIVEDERDEDLLAVLDRQRRDRALDLQLVAQRNRWQIRTGPSFHPTYRVPAAGGQYDRPGPTAQRLGRDSTGVIERVRSSS